MLGPITSTGTPSPTPEHRSAGADVELVGGADVAPNCEAKRAIEQATRLAARL